MADPVATYGASGRSVCQGRSWRASRRWPVRASRKCNSPFGAAAATMPPGPYASCWKHAPGGSPCPACTAAAALQQRQSFCLDMHLQEKQLATHVRPPLPRCRAWRPAAAACAKRQPFAPPASRQTAAPCLIYKYSHASSRALSQTAQTSKALSQHGGGFHASCNDSCVRPIDSTTPTSAAYKCLWWLRGRT